MRTQDPRTRIVWTLCALLVGSLMLPSVSSAASAQAINAGADKALGQFQSKVKGADVFLRGAKGVLVFPEVIQAGIGVGGEYGEGVLRVGGASVAYYSLTAGSFGFQLGAQRKSIIIAFLTTQALQGFRARARTNKAWQVGVDGSVAVLNLGAQASITSTTFSHQPIVGFVFGQAGLMYDLSLRGSKIARIQR
jgi:lipid-binding SYLF domain-containing protein